MVLPTQVDVRSEQFKKNFQYMKQKTTQLKQALALVKAGGGEDAQKRHKNRGKYLVRERINLLKDPNTCFLEFSALAGGGVYKENPASAGIVTGIAVINGRPCAIAGNDATVKGGAYFPLTVKKHLRAQEIALENNLPCIYLVDSGGAYLPYQDEIFPDKNHFGRIFYNQAQLSARGVPQIAVVFGHCTAGGAYVPAMSDENIIVKNKGAVFLGGPPLVKAATGEITSAEELGGAKVHTTESGVSDYMAEDEDTAIKLARRITTHLGQTQPRLSWPLQNNEEPRYPMEEIYGLLPSDFKTPFDVREIIARLVDGSRFDEFKKNYGVTLAAGWAHICGCPVGILANNGVLFSESALKAVHFIDLCDQRKIPLLFLQNIVGFMVGKQYEKQGITKHGAKMVTAVSLARVPKFTVMIGSSYGAGNYGMCGRAYQPRQLWMWPTARIAVMGGAQAEKVLHSIKSSSKNQSNESLEEQYNRQSTAYYSTARLWDDGIIDPLDTRKVLALGLNAAGYAPLGNKLKGIYRM